MCVVGNAQGGVCRGWCRLCERLMCVCRVAGSDRCIGVMRRAMYRVDRLWLLCGV